jgi:hypothetical protein
MLPIPQTALILHTYNDEFQPLLKPTGFRKDDARWPFGSEINLTGVQTLGHGLGTLIREKGICEGRSDGRGSDAAQDDRRARPDRVDEHACRTEVHRRILFARPPIAGRNDLTWRLGERRWNALLFGFCIACLIPTRPGAFVAALPMIAVDGSYLLRTAIGESPGRMHRLREIAASLPGALVPVGGYVAFNSNPYGNALGGDVNAVQGNGFYVGMLPERFFSHILHSYAFYGEAGADWLSVLPFIALSLAFLVPALFAGPLVFRAAAAQSVAVPVGRGCVCRHRPDWHVPVFQHSLFQVDVPEAARRTASRRVTAAVIVVGMSALCVSTRETRVAVASMSSDQHHLSPCRRRVSITSTFTACKEV